MSKMINDRLNRGLKEPDVQRSILEAKARFNQSVFAKVEKKIEQKKNERMARSNKKTN